MNDAPIDRRVARDAARWFVRLQTPGVSDAQRHACHAWRAEHTEHERAWVLAEAFNTRLKLIPPQLGSAALDRPQDADRRRALKALALLIAAGPVAFVAQRSQPWQQWRADVRSGTGEQRQITLEDGTQIQLNTDSAIDIAYDSTLRRVLLVGGEIMVSTGKDPANRPFVLETAQGYVRPIGTRFLVRQLQDASQVAVLEGAVQLSTLAHPQLQRRLNAGEQSRFNTLGIAAAEPAQAQASDWTRGVLKAERMPLAQFAAELGRYRPGLLRCDPGVASLQVSGAFQLHDTDQALQALTKVLAVEIVYRTRYWVTISPRPA
jgi:transmembrane sensor